ncbi:hypothetical protein D3C85_1626360 [compost metagenome]
MIESAMIGLWRMDQHRQNHRRSGQMGYAMFCYQIKDRCRLGLSHTDLSAADNSQGPAMRPAVAMKQRQRPKVGAARSEPHRQSVAKCIQCRPSMGIDDSFGIACCARGITQRNGRIFVNDLG